MKKDEIKNITRIVRMILEDEPMTRNSDSLLFIRVCALLNPAIIEKNFCEVMGNLKTYNLPSYDTVGRVRRKIQECHSELAAVDCVAVERTDNEFDFRQFARGTV